MDMKLSFVLAVIIFDFARMQEKKPHNETKMLRVCDINELW